LSVDLLQGHYANAVQLINRSERVMCQGDLLPIDLKVRRGTDGCVIDVSFNVIDIVVIDVKVRRV